MDIEKPIFFIGMPRSGTTVTFEVFAAHRELGWLSNYSRRLPQFPYVTVVHRLFGDRRGRKSQDQTISLVRRLLPEPMEDYAIWNSFFGESFSRSFLEGHTAQPDQIRACRAYMGKILLAECKSRLCVKFTGPPRKRFLEHVFPDAYFINVVRDPRAVVASLLTVYFWKQRGLTQPVLGGRAELRRARRLGTVRSQPSGAGGAAVVCRVARHAGGDRPFPQSHGVDHL